MTKINICGFSMLFLVSVLLASCATPKKPIEIKKSEEVKPAAESKKPYAPTVQETKSLDLFTEILDVIETSKDRKSALPKIEELYSRIIREYPEAPLAQESYWKLITIYVKDYSPPDYEKAEARYKEFVEKYPQSILKGLVQDTIGKSYHKYAQWDRLLELCAPTYKEYIENGKQPRASLLFMYAEANYNLGNIPEAEKSYKIVVDLFPKVREGLKSRAMLEKIEKKED